MMGRFDNKVVLVTGGAGGLGRATVLAFAAEGASIVFSYHNSATEAVDEVCAQAQSFGAAIEPCRADISQSADVTALVGAAMARFGRIDILVNSAGLSRDDAFLSLTEEAFDEVIAVNLKGLSWSHKLWGAIWLRKNMGGSLTFPQPPQSSHGQVMPITPRQRLA